MAAEILQRTLKKQLGTCFLLVDQVLTMPFASSKHAPPADGDPSSKLRTCPVVAEKFRFQKIDLSLHRDEAIVLLWYRSLMRDDLRDA